MAQQNLSRAGRQDARRDASAERSQPSLLAAANLGVRVVGLHHHRRVVSLTLLTGAWLVSEAVSDTP